MNIDIAGLPPERIVFETSPLAELGLALHALSEPGHHPGLHGWATATAASLEPDLADRLHEADFLWRNTFSDVFMPFAGVRGGDGRTGATLAEDLDILDRLDDERFVASALEFTCASLYGTGAPSPLSDPLMRARALDMAAARGPGRWSSPGSCWPTPSPYAAGSGVSSRTATRRSSRTPGAGSRSSWSPTPGTRRICCAARGPVRRWAPCPPHSRSTRARAGSAPTR